MNLSKRMSVIKPSATMAVTEKAAALKARGIEVLNLGAGEPDFDTAPHIKAAAVAALEKGQTKYTPVGGTIELRKAIVEKVRRDNGLTYDPSEVLASCGGKHSLFVAFHVLFGDEEEVLIPAPFWVSYPDMLALAGARSKILHTKLERGFKLTPEDLEAAITPQTRAIILNSPSNPAGVAYDRKELTALADVLAKHPNLIVFCDDVYEMMVYGDFDRAHLLNVKPELRDRTIICNSVSKTYAMTGWRIGYTAGPKNVISAMSTLQGQMTSNPSSIAQAGAAMALAGSQEQVPGMMREFEKRRDVVVERLNSIPGVICPMPQGAFYVFPNVGAFLKKDPAIKSGDDLAAYLIEKANVALVGGTDFGYPDHIRISYATSMEVLEEAILRMRDALAPLKS